MNYREISDDLSVLKVKIQNLLNDEITLGKIVYGKVVKEIDLIQEESNEIFLRLAVQLAYPKSPIMEPDVIDQSDFDDAK